jgi:hypothetical protein
MLQESEDEDIPSDEYDDAESDLTPEELALLLHRDEQNNRAWAQSVIKRTFGPRPNEISLAVSINEIRGSFDLGLHVANETVGKFLNRCWARLTNYFAPYREYLHSRKFLKLFISGYPVSSFAQIHWSFRKDLNRPFVTISSELGGEWWEIITILPIELFGVIFYNYLLLRENENPLEPFSYAKFMLMYTEVFQGAHFFSNVWVSELEIIYMDSDR